MSAPEGIQTERLILRTLQSSDAEPLFRYRSDPGVSRNQTWSPQAIDEVRSFVHEQSLVEPFSVGTWTQLGITLRSGELIGDCGIHPLEIDPSQAEMGITLAPGWQGRGYATEAVRAILDKWFCELNKHRVICSVDPRNTRSVALMERLGFRKEGHMIESLWLKGEWVDDAVFAMLRRDWRSSRP